MSVSAELCRRFSGFIEIATAWFTVNSVGSSVSTPTIINPTLTIAGTEYSFALPANTQKFSVVNRGDGKLQIAYTSGQSGTIFKTVPPGVYYEEESISPSAALSLFIQSDKAMQVLEIVSWA